MTAVKSLSGAVLICTLVLTSADAAKKTAKPAEPMAQDTSLNNQKDAPKAPALACEPLRVGDGRRADRIDESRIAPRASADRAMEH